MSKAIQQNPASSQSLPQSLPQLLTRAASHAGRKAENQDTLTMQTLVPTGDSSAAQLAWQVTALADGVSSCGQPKLASQWVIDTLIDQLTMHQADMVTTPVTSPITSPVTSDSLNNNSAETLAQMLTKSVHIINDFLYFSDHHDSFDSASQRYLPKLLSTLSGLLFTEPLLSEHSAVLFHTGDSRIYRLRHNKLRVLTQDHRHKRGRDKGALAAALGADAQVELQLAQIDVLPEDVFLIMTDGVYEFIGDDELLLLTQSALGKLLALDNSTTFDLENLPETLCQVALENGSNDNVSCVMIAVLPKVARILANADFDKADFAEHTDSRHAVTRLRIPPVLTAGDKLDHFTIDKVVQNTPRSSVYLATDSTADTGNNQRIIKVPSAYYEDDSVFLRLFLKEEKIGLSLNHPSLLKFYPKPMNSQYLYHVTEFLQGMSLREFIDTQPPLSVAQTFAIVNQIGMALRAMHRNYLLHQDIKPENIMLLPSGHIKLIDFGSVGSLLLRTGHTPPVGDLHYTAPEYFSDAPKGVYSDIFSLGVVTYEMLTGLQPFDVDTLTTAMTAQTTQKLAFKNVRQLRTDLPFWVNDVLIRALQADSNRRYQSIGDFLTDLDPKSHAEDKAKQPLIDKHPVLFWQLVSGILTVLLLITWLMVALNH